MGLAVVWGTVKDHHGYINVKEVLINGVNLVSCGATCSIKQ
jgi:hypothetical protein